MVQKYESPTLLKSSNKSDIIFAERWSHIPSIYIDEVMLKFYRNILLNCIFRLMHLMLL